MMPQSDETQWQSVLTERPNTERPWSDDMSHILWIILALGVCILTGIGIANWLSEKAERGASSSADKAGGGL